MTEPKNRPGSSRRRHQAAYRKGQEEALAQLEPLMREVIVAIGLLATANPSTTSRNKELIERLEIDATECFQDAIAEIRRLEGEVEALRLLTKRQGDMMEHLRQLANSTTQREQAAQRVAWEAAQWSADHWGGLMPQPDGRVIDQSALLGGTDDPA